jgi:hypothetical protein
MDIKVPSIRRFAIVYTVKNEANMLPDAIAYHLQLGCSRIFVFFDGTTDNSRDLVQELPGVVCADAVDPRLLSNPPAWIRLLLPRWEESMDVRKRINTFVAAQQSQNEGIEWLISIDPDELLILNDDLTCVPHDCETFFSSVSKDIDQILVPNWEGVPVGGGTGRPFVDCTLFLRRFPVTEGVWRYSAAVIRRVVSNPKLHAWYDYWFYRMRFMGALPRLMRHPVTNETIPAGYFLGYSNHKAFIRTAAAQKFLFNIHRWQKAQRRPKSIKKGRLLHYDLISVDYFCAKFRQRQPAMMVKAFYCRYMFAQIARELSFDAARQFFLKYICVSDSKTIARLLRRRILAEIGHISEFMKKLPAR